MNSFLVRFHALRLSTPAMFLILLLQRTPVVQWLLRADAAPPGVFATVLRSAMLATIAGGAVHTLTGATVFVSNPASPAAAKVGTPFSMVFSVASSASGTGFYMVSGTLPPGLSIAGMDSSGGVSGSAATISGTPTTAGAYSVSIQAWGPGNSAASFTNGVSYSLTINVAAAVGTGPSITTQPASTSVTVGGSASFSVAATGTPTPTYQWQKGGAAIAGATSATLSLTNVQNSDAGTYAVVVTNSAGSVTSANVTLSVAAALGPSITTQPRDLALPAGYAGTLTVVASGTAPLTYQWSKDSAAIPGATAASLAFASAQPSDSGNYTVVVTSPDGTVTSTVAKVAVGTSAAKFINLSTRGFVGTGPNVLIAGLVITGPNPKTVLIRVVGPTLAQLGLSSTDVLADPVASLRDPSGAEILSNDDWGTGANVSILPQVFHTVGAFDLPVGSKDAVALVTLDPGIYTVIASGKNGSSGIALLETYEVP